MHRLLPLLFLLVAACCSSCNTGEIKQKTNDQGSLSHAPMVDMILGRHDTYVKADPKLDEEQKASFLADSIVIRTAFKEEKVKVEPIYQTSLDLLQRHDAYVVADPGKAPEARLRALRSSQLMRETFHTAMGVEPTPDSRPEK